MSTTDLLPACNDRWVRSRFMNQLQNWITFYRTSLLVTGRVASSATLAEPRYQPSRSNVVDILVLLVVPGIRIGRLQSLFVLFPLLWRQFKGTFWCHKRWLNGTFYQHVLPTTLILCLIVAYAVLECLTKPQRVARIENCYSSRRGRTISKDWLFKRKNVCVKYLQHIFMYWSSFMPKLLCSFHCLPNPFPRTCQC